MKPVVEGVLSAEPKATAGNGRLAAGQVDGQKESGLGAEKPAPGHGGGLVGVGPAPGQVGKRAGRMAAEEANGQGNSGLVAEETALGQWGRRPEASGGKAQAAGERGLTQRAGSAPQREAHRQGVFEQQPQADGEAGRCVQATG